MSRLVLVTPPATEPLSLADAKAQVRLQTTSDDSLVTTFITAAREYCERRSHLGFITQTWDLWLDNWNNVSFENVAGYFGGDGMAGITLYNNPQKMNHVTLPLGPVQSVTWVKYTDFNNNQQTWNSSNYCPIVSGTNPARITPVQGTSFPSVALQDNAIQIRFVIGYGGYGSVPQALCSAMRLCFERLYEIRGAVNVGNIVTEVPIGVDDLLSSWTCGNNLFC